jgi:hypothetical protein
MAGTGIEKVLKKKAVPFLRGFCPVGANASLEDIKPTSNFLACEKPYD